ncbi:hypothetical protein [Desulfonema magnum]|uniref:Endonuclease domain-containing protein n=1 Tax=Desulfonema magnum TaxID=45655 RepID=A0A975BUH0_9BACT|nr:hypothetical protein [Desulfonema magnum]QTA91464.1 endonuclease domain-containing protein [Desulfonema magnum]
MSANLRKQVDTLETRTDSLESILGQFISSMNSTMLRQEADTRAFKDEMRAFKDEMRTFRENTDRTLTRMEADTKALKEEMRESKKEMRNDSRKLRQEIGRLDNKIGMLVEDMVAPNIPGVAAEYFGDSHFRFSGLRIKKPRGEDLSAEREFDFVAISEKNFYVNETKSKPRPEDVRGFLEMLKELPEYFPECRNRKIIPIFSSLHIPENMVINLTRHGIYAMAMREDTMDLLNFDEVIGT